MGTIAANDRRAPAYTAAGGQTDFSVDFKPFKDGAAYAGVVAARTRGAVVTTLTLDDFDVVGAADDSFTARLHTPALAGDELTFYARTPTSRNRQQLATSGFSTVVGEADIEQLFFQGQELRRDVDTLLAMAGIDFGHPIGGGDGEISWADIPDKPAFGALALLNTVDYATQVSGKPATFTPAPHVHDYTADLTGKPVLGALAAKGTVNNTDWAGLDLSLANGGTGASDAATARANLGVEIGVNVLAFHQAVQAIAAAGPASAGKVFEWTGAGAGHFINTPAGGGGGAMEPRVLSDYGVVDNTGANPATNDPVITAAEAATDSAVYLPDGIFAKSAAAPAFSNLTKGYTGRGRFKEGTSILPARFSYAAVKPATAATQGLTGWFDGDQRFTDGGEYKILGPNHRRYDLTPLRYYESNLIPHHAWFDNLSGNSGCNGLLIAGAAAGATTVVITGADVSWIGQDCELSLTYAGATLETKHISNVVGNNVTFSTPLANNYVVNPAIGQFPNLRFGLRTWNGHTYVKVKAQGGGDTYGHIVRTTMSYAPVAAELPHTFMAGTVGQYGGDIAFTTAGTYATSLEFAAYDQGNDVAHVGYVHSFVRDNDHGGAEFQHGGRHWVGMRFQSSGRGYVDAGLVIAGQFRTALDTAQAFLGDSTSLTAAAIATATTLTVYNTNGAKVGQQVVITDGVNSDVCTLTAVTPGSPYPTIGISPALGHGYAKNTLVKFPQGGAIISAALGQKMVFNSAYVSRSPGVGVYPRGVHTGLFGPLYSNVIGDMEIGAENDGISDYLYMRFNGLNHGGSTARLRLRPDAFQVNIQSSFGQGVSVAREVTVLGSTANGGRPTLYLGPTAWIDVDSPTGGGGTGNVRVTKDSGATYGILR